MKLEQVLAMVMAGEPLAPALEGKSLTEVVEVMSMLHDQLESVKAVKAKLQSAYDYVRIGRVPELMDEQGIRNITLEGIGRVTLTADAYVSVPADNRQIFHHWLTDNGYSDLISETVNSSTLKAWCMRRVKEGEDLPEMVKFTPYSRASITKA